MSETTKQPTRGIKPEEAVGKLHEILTLLAEYSSVVKWDITDTTRGKLNLLLQQASLGEIVEAIQSSVNHFEVDDKGRVFVPEGFDVNVKVHLDLVEVDG